MPRDSGQTDRLIRRLRWDDLDRAWLLRFAEIAREEDPVSYTHLTLPTNREV